MDANNPWTLQPGLDLVNAHAVPVYKANQEVLTYPAPSNLNYCCRPSTVEYGTAPYMAGKGAPHDLIGVEDELRPQSTMEFNKYYAQNAYSFPSMNVQCKLPVRTRSWDPQDTRGELQNGLFVQRYCDNK